MFLNASPVFIGFLGLMIIMLFFDKSRFIFSNILPVLVTYFYLFVIKKGQSLPILFAINNNLSLLN